MVCEFKNIRLGIAAIGCAISMVWLAACSGDKICEPPIPAESSADSSSSVIPAESSAESSSSVILSGDSREESSDSRNSSSSAAGQSSNSVDGGSTPAMTSSSSSSALSTISSSSERSEGDPSSSSSSRHSGLDPESSSSSPYLWHDEFDGESIDLSKWTFEIGTGAGGWGNNEWEYYTSRKENAYIKDGVLHIRAQKENYEGQKYTSARMLTKGKFAFKYGTVEARIALPTGKGIWPAFWMLGQNIDEVSWPACGEIDIIETINDENIVYGTHHWQYNGNHASYGNNTKDYYGTSKELDITQFHTYKMVWNEKLIAMYVDEFKYQEIDIESAKDGLEAFHKPQFFILNVAVAGNWPGFEVDDSQFPNEMLVDYIRVESRR